MWTFPTPMAVYRLNYYNDRIHPTMCPPLAVKASCAIFYSLGLHVVIQGCEEVHVFALQVKFIDQNELNRRVVNVDH